MAQNNFGDFLVGLGLAATGVGLYLMSKDEDELSKQIETLYQEKKQKRSTSVEKEKIRRDLEQRIKSKLRVSSLKVLTLGSSHNSAVALDDSDLDLCTAKHDRYSTTIDKIRDVISEMELVHDLYHIRSLDLIRFSYGPRIKVDLQVYTDTVLRNTTLIESYIAVDQRFAKLALVLKIWAKANGVHNAGEGKLSSYALNLLLIQYLQDGCSPPVLPCLHRNYHEVLCSPDPTAMSNIKVRLSPANEQNLGDLMVGFFRYYTEDVDLGWSKIDVRRGKPIRIAYVDSDGWRNGERGRLIHVEEPFVRSNVTKMIKSFTFDMIQNAIHSSYRALLNHRDLNEIIRQI